MDAGYLSRILKQFEKSRLVGKKQSPEDGRSYFLHLTGRGEKVLAALNARSDTHIGKLLEPLPEWEQARLVRSMLVIEDVLTANKPVSRDDITIRHEFGHGDIGYLIHMHGWIYARECRYPLAFEGYVAQTFYTFMETYDANRDRIWLAEHKGEIIGSIGIAGQSEKAQLRWLLLHPGYRGIGLGKRLFDAALNYLLQRKGVCKSIPDNDRGPATGNCHVYQRGFCQGA